MGESADIESIRAVYAARFPGFSRVEINAGYDGEDRFRIWDQLVYGEGNPPTQLRLATPAPGKELDREPEVDVAPILEALKRDRRANGWEEIALTFYANGETLRFEDFDAEVALVAFLMRSMAYDHVDTTSWDRITIRATRVDDEWRSLFLVDRSDWLPPLVDMCSLPWAGLGDLMDRLVKAAGPDGASISEIVMTTTHHGRHELNIARDGERFPDIPVPTVEDYTRCVVEIVRGKCTLEGHFRLHFGVGVDPYAATVIDYDAEEYPDEAEHWNPEDDDWDRLFNLGQAIAVLHELRTGEAPPGVVLDCVPGREPVLRLEDDLD